MRMREIATPSSMRISVEFRIVWNAAHGWIEREREGIGLRSLSSRTTSEHQLRGCLVCCAAGRERNRAIINRIDKRDASRTWATFRCFLRGHSALGDWLMNANRFGTRGWWRGSKGSYADPYTKPFMVGQRRRGEKGKRRRCVRVSAPIGV